VLERERDRTFRDWLHGHKGILFKVVHAYAFTPADREDLFQEIALQVWCSVDAFRGESAVATWLYRVALNTAIAWNRKEKRHQHAAAGCSQRPAETALPRRDPRLDSLYAQIAQLDEVDRSLALLMLDGSATARWRAFSASPKTTWA
jgi:RNA polymerase sigma-70 factor (ECF subfamily)